ncbi:hypothetical protein DFJ58DRAFT_733558 [Suillus subalutaceus]|uniref:uncharacterized protein n=1 Tax=Suillus subalutaceus TaxID=48586 RepID=UPI001B86B048|nr:uncharacterized protein DFJ58DRAFT_733558 [Suillus subalutaceus]KAG1838908.1 hypothetical protein DFJ58DRAFT_733558 [Suillus subalutaceus]
MKRTEGGDREVRELYRPSTFRLFRDILRTCQRQESRNQATIPLAPPAVVQIPIFQIICPQIHSSGPSLTPRLHAKTLWKTYIAGSCRVADVVCTTAIAKIRDEFVAMVIHAPSKALNSKEEDLWKFRFYQMR